MTRSYFVGVDIGGTFTDLVIGDDAGDSLHRVKTLTTPADPVDGVLTALREGLELTGAAPGDVARFVHATTLTTNLELERKGARVAYVTTRGFGDMFALGKGYPTGQEMFNLLHVRQPPFVNRDMVFELAERMSAKGEAIHPLTPEAMDALCEQIVAAKPQSVAICLLHAHVNNAHELMLAERLRALLPDVYIAVSSRIWSEIGEYERGATTRVSAYIGPTLSHYLERLDGALKGMGLACPLQIMQSSGGIMAAADAGARAVYTLESGPAAGVVSAGALGTECGYPRIISFDMGGTTAKAGLVEQGEPRITYNFWVGGGASAGGSGGGEPIRLPIIDLAEVGAGGGSIASIDQGGFLCVGPRSAGADPGPACYGLGGKLPTVTDANLVLGYLDSGFFVGGKMVLQPDLARAAIETHVAAPLGLSVQDAAWRIHELANASMGSAVRIVTVHRGVDPRNHMLMAFGGAGPLHAVRVAEEFGIPNVLIPALPGVRSAFGLLQSDLSYDFSQGIQTPTAQPNLAALDRIFTGLEEQARTYTSADGLVLSRALEIRFVHQSLRIKVEIPTAPLTARIVAEAEARFRLDYFNMCAISPADDCIVVNCWINARSVTEKLPTPACPAGDGDVTRALKGEREAYFPGRGFRSTPVYDLVWFRAGDVITGPALVEEVETTTVIPPRYRMSIDNHGNLLIESED